MGTDERDLPLALRRVLTEIPDLGLQERFEQVFFTAAKAIAQLRQFDLSKYESGRADEENNLQLLEEVAPILASTVMEVNALVAAIDENFPNNQAPTESEEELPRAARAVCSRSSTARSRAP